MSYYGWSSAYTFDEEVDLEVSKCWMMAVPYAIPVRKPLCHLYNLFYNSRSFVWAVEQLMVPTTKGVTWRSIEGLFYFGLRPASAEEERQREPIYLERMKPWLEDFEGIWRGKLVPELMADYERLKKPDLAKLSNIELLEHLEYWLLAVRRGIAIHYLPLYVSYTAYQRFDQLCQELLSIDEDHPQFKKLMTGFTSVAYDVDRGLWRLGDRASELGLEPLFKATPDDEEVLGKLEQSEPGRKWLHELHEFLSVHGWRVDRLFDVSVPNWIEQPALALPVIRGNMAKGRGGFLKDQEHERLVKEREEAERDAISRVPEDKRDWFSKLMRTAQWSGIYSEEHDYYLDLYQPAVGRPIFMEIGKRGTQAGVLDDPDDVNFLNFEEIMRLLVNMETSVFRKIVRMRKQEWQRYIEGAPKMLAEKLMIGDPDWFFQNLGREPVMWVFAGRQKIKPELKADLYGMASAPGVAEGVARVLWDPAQLSEIAPGEILVVPSTNPAWNPAFNFVKAVVTDAGGALSHAIIVARDYGLPCVAGTREATAKIKTGDRIKVDGDMNAVYILERAS